MAPIMTPLFAPQVPAVVLLVRDIGKSRDFYAKGLGYVPGGGCDAGAGAGETLAGAFGQSLRLVPVVSDRPVAEVGCMHECMDGRVVLCVSVADRERAASAIMAHGGGRAANRLGDTPLYLGPDGELILLEERGLPGVERVRLVVYDFDGVMTDNRVFVDQDGRESVAANRSDGLAVGMIARLGVDQCILSTETNPVVQARAMKLGLIAESGVADKPAALVALAERRGVALADILFVGNDVNDAGAMALAGFCVAPADAHPSVRALAGYVTLARGGHGVVRELADLLMAARS
ncbi:MULTISPECIES: HAD hydrolase family protein [Pseudodesulfovibrio]|uniref:Haloacid dehalogenase domain protein hydrolase type 3 n=1 Tax=Pseudodesulfovibrio aespoeensis (strain ATCC 700646 / DSM 10631 / Aspo-2) TaxID=643562 RepID=E6VTV7_PSEA9|nr:MULTISPECIES: HAD hydrolase family protein [Pseudodesulfovibrio]ADU61049.1 Haloacid dehalogenase domain protein hydrolase type 3 [Pseudodesulfovibrio aespoeensis Aspo-2]MCG2731627.1 HAD hydrolase family protein [Pseudodesulfovibrio aespoeensis]